MQNCPSDSAKLEIVQQTPGEAESFQENSEKTEIRAVTNGSTGAIAPILRVANSNRNVPPSKRRPGDVFNMTAYSLNHDRPTRSGVSIFAPLDVTQDIWTTG